jgi:hypothetical protein
LVHSSLLNTKAKSINNLFIVALIKGKKTDLKKDKLIDLWKTLVGTTPKQHEDQQIIYSHLIQHMHYRFYSLSLLLHVCVGNH